MDKARRDDWPEPQGVSMNHEPLTKMPMFNDKNARIAGMLKGKEQIDREIAEMLKGKKEQIDREIANFKAEKEKEYIAFEQSLRAGDREMSVQGSVSSSSDARDIDKRRGEGFEEFSRAPSSPSSHDREAEAQGLFYIPLLDSPRDSTSTLSSSADLPTSIIGSSSSRPNAHGFSVSLPKEGSLALLRSSSSRSDTSIASLRSSLRDPKLPRSPKRVLFSIDNVVVAPSTSPIALRSSSAPQAQMKRVDNIPKGLERLVMGKSKESYKVEGGWDGRVCYTNPQNTDAKPVSSKGKDASDAENANSWGGGDDSKRVGDDDDLFPFDEDMDLGATAHTKKKNSDVESDDEDSGFKKAYTFGSPNARSSPRDIDGPNLRKRVDNHWM
ncbi:hypothetical protein MMC07_003922 [Pseudocyphellaria aurata]|nr:hypothetical protein [Pseudocyphellaria aurata]